MDEIGKDEQGSPDDKSAENKILVWRDRYSTRVDRELSSAFAGLAALLEEKVADNLWEIVFLSKYSFTKGVIQPELDGWMQRHVRPILDDAAGELTEVPFDGKHLFRNDFVARVHQVIGSPILFALIGGISIFLGFSLGLVTVKWWEIWKDQVNEPILFSLLFVGAALIAFGAFRFALCKRKVKRLFRETCLPKLSESILGEGIDNEEGVRQPSLRAELQSAIQETAGEHLRRASNP